ncbi:MAG: MG2 domain-containing protein, partial [Anaerolineales bacterium]
MDTNQRNLLRRFGVPIFLAALILAGAGVYFIIRYLGIGGGPGTVIPGGIDTSGQTDGGPSTPEEGESDFAIKLSEGQQQPDLAEPLALATGEALSADEIVAVLARLPALIRDRDDQADFRLPDEVIPPPRTGETIEETFPPQGGTGPVSVDTGPLEVLRFAPEGEIPIAPFINVTFNQPMVPITTIEDLSESEVPVQVEPDLEGTWRWLGTKTLNFQYDSEFIDRLPMATEFTVTIPAGTTSATGGVLEEQVQFAFRTPTVTMTTHYPYSNEPQPRDPLFFIAFNQRIEPQAVFDTIQVSVDGQQVELKLVDREEAQQDERIKQLIENTHESRWLAFKATRLLPADVGVTVTVGPGTPSAEGPLLTESAQSYSFRTYAPLKIVNHGCSWYDDDCPPLTPLFIEFNNPLDLDAYEQGMLRIEPELPGANVNIYGDTITVQGATEGRTTYRITVDGDIKDVFGQQLGRDQTLRFRIGPAEPVLIGPDQIFVTIDPSTQEPALSLYAINYNSLDVRIFAVNPHDWPEFQEYMYEFQRTDTPPDPPGQLVFDDNVKLDLPADTLSEVPIGLSDYMDGEYGQFIVIAKPPSGLFQEDRYWETVQAWVQVTQIGVDAFVDHSEMVIWTTALQDGSPLEGVMIESNNNAQLGSTNSEGTADFAIPDGGASYVVARKGADKALLPSSTYYWGNDSWVQRPQSDQLRWYVFDDRGMYRPGEQVHIKGWMRRIGGGQQGDVGLVGSAVDSVNYQLMGPQGNEISNGSVDVNALGGFDFVITLPENTNLGYAQLILNAWGSLGSLQTNTFYHNFQIQEFRRPEFEVSARNETTGPYFVGGHAIVAVQAKYYTGDPLTNAEVNWAVTSTPTNYSPPNWPEFSFGTWTPWWWYEDLYGGGTGNGQTTVETYSGVTDASGEHYLRMEFAGSLVPRPRSISAEGTVFDVNRQAWTGRTTLMVHPAALYVGMRSDRYFVEQGEPLDIELIVTDIDGNPVADRPIRVTAARLEWKYTGGRWQQVEADLQECTVGSSDLPVSCSFETPLGGRYRIRAEITDEEGRTNQSSITRWVSGGQRPPSRDVELEQVTLIPDKETYQPGDIAEILVQSPFSPAEGLLTVARSGILYTQRFLIENGTITLKVPIEDKHIPNL